MPPMAINIKHLEKGVLHAEVNQAQALQSNLPKLESFK